MNKPALFLALILSSQNLLAFEEDLRWDVISINHSHGSNRSQCLSQAARVQAELTRVQGLGVPGASDLYVTSRYTPRSHNGNIAEGPCNIWIASTNENVGVEKIKYRGDGCESFLDAFGPDPKILIPWKCGGDRGIPAMVRENGFEGVAILVK